VGQRTLYDRIRLSSKIAEINECQGRWPHQKCEMQLLKFRCIFAAEGRHRRGLQTLHQNWNPYSREGKKSGVYASKSQIIQLNHI
jgi:hypothetical protein